MTSVVAWCEHDRLAMHCEDCLYARAFERGEGLPDQPKVEQAAKPTLAGEDLLFDNGRGVEVLVAAGDPIPARLADLPRRARNPVPRADAPAQSRRATKPPSARAQSPKRR